MFEENIKVLSNFFNLTELVILLLYLIAYKIPLKSGVGIKIFPVLCVKLRYLLLDTWYLV